MSTYCLTFVCILTVRSLLFEHMFCDLSSSKWQLSRGYYLLQPIEAFYHFLSFLKDEELEKTHMGPFCHIFQ